MKRRGRPVRKNSVWRLLQSYRVEQRRPGPRDLRIGGARAQVRLMFCVDESAAEAIRKAYDERGEFSVVVELRRHFPGITDDENARLCTQTIAGWQRLPLSPPHGKRGCRTGRQPARGQATRRRTGTPEGRVAVLALSLCLALARGGAHGQDVSTPPDDFASAMDTAMARMDRDMMGARSGDADRDFAAMMIPHHQGAIDMARAQLRFGHDPVLRRLAQGIIVEQQQEIAVMREALKALPLPANADVTPSRHKSMER